MPIAFLNAVPLGYFFLWELLAVPRHIYRLLNLFSGARYNLCLPDSIQKSAGMGEFHIDSK